MSEKPSGAPESYIQEKDAAEVGAYAEKPIRDAIVDYKKQLVEKYGEKEAKQATEAMEWIASEEGEKAMAAYREGQEQEDPRVTLLREKAKQTILLTEFLSDDMMVEQVVAEQLKTVGMTEADKIITSGLTVTEKIEQVKIVGTALNSGVGASSTSEWPDEVAQRYCKELGRGQWSVEQTVFLLKGRMIADMALGKGKRGIATLESIAGLEDRSINEVVAENLDVILGTRKQIQDVFPEVDAGQRNKWIDQGMENLGWLWDKTNETYVGPEGEK